MFIGYNEWCARRFECKADHSDTSQDGGAIRSEDVFDSDGADRPFDMSNQAAELELHDILRVPHEPEAREGEVEEEEEEEEASSSLCS